MTRWTTEDENEDEGEGWDEDEEEGETIPCPYCRCPIHEESLRCPHCENYLSQEDTPFAPKPAWIMAGVVLCLLLVLLWILGG
jgi:hypothetical protein